MRTSILLPVLFLLTACGKSEAPPAPPATAAAPAVTESPQPTETAVATEPATDAVSAPTWMPTDAPGNADTPASSTGDMPSAPAAPAPEVAGSAPDAGEAQVAPATEPAPAPETAPQAAPAATEVPAAAATEAAGDTPYHVVDGKIDADTVEGWKIYRGIGTCATCHGPVGQGGVGPALVESLKEKITKELFVEVVSNGRDGTMMKPFGENPNVMQNIDKIYAYLKARADGVLGPENLLKYPLGKIE